MRFARRSIVALAVTIAACHGGSSGASVTLPSFADLTAAPAAIQSAAEAVVRIHTAGEDATGFFVSSTGLLLTNNHVLGVGICPVEGCFVELSIDYELGAAVDVSDVFVVPVAVSVGLDMALVQVYMSQGGDTLTSPNFLTLEPHDSASLVGTHVNIVGHPFGDLKKWTTGEVYDTDGEWIEMTAYILPGNSGSPILNDAGKVVGIIHRGPTEQDLYTSTGVATYSIGTASAPLAAAMSAALPPEMVSVNAATTADALVAANHVYLNAGTSSVMLTGGGMTDVLDALATACDAGLAVTDYATPEDLTAGLQPCFDARFWIECRSDVNATAYPRVCPLDPNDAAAWAQRFQQVSGAFYGLNGQLDLDTVSFGIASLSDTYADGVTAGGASLTTALSNASYPLDPEVSLFLAAFSVPSYADQDIVHYVSSYTAIVNYAAGADDLAYAAYYLSETGQVGETTADGWLAALAADPTVDLGAKLDIESIRYGWGTVE